MSPGLLVLTLIAALGAATAGGVFFAFSSFVMAGLTRLAPAGGLAAMQSINVTAVRPLFMSQLFGTAALCLGLSAWALADPGDRRAALLIAGAALYLVGAIGVTIARNVPLNDRIAALDPAGAGAPEAWSRYLRAWVGWNHVRTVASLAGAAAFALAPVA